MKPFYISLKPFLDYRALSCPADWKKVFHNDNPLEVEIGFGNGEYLAHLAQEFPQTNFIGFEEYCERIHKTLRKLSRVNNEGVRVLRMDVRPAFTYLFAPGTIRYIHCLYPPPWPKKSDIKHRLFTTEFLKLVNNRLADGGTLKIVTDHYPYILWIQEQLPGTGFKAQLKHIPASYHTKFERKWSEGGQKEFYELLLNKAKTIDIIEKKENPVQRYTLTSFAPQRFQLQDHSADGIAVVFKDMLFDSARQIAMVHVLVNDEHIFQNLRIIIHKDKDHWNINLAEGTMMMPTAGVAKALELVHEAALAAKE
jgi:tRNA (guanine-N7-)-methyltransferase